MFALVALALAFAPSLDDPAWLQWDAPDVCPDAAYVQRATVDRLGRAPKPDEVHVHVDVVDRGAEGLQLTLQTTRDGQTDTRSMTAHNCLALADATALTVALSIDPVAVARHVATPTEPAPPTVIAEPEPPLADATPDPPSPTQAPPPQPAARTPSPRDPTALLLSVGGGLTVGALPGVSGGPTLGLALAWPRVRLETAGWYVAPRTADRTAASVRVQAGAAVVRGCARLGTLRVEVPLCGGVEVGGMRGQGRNARGARTTTGLWLAPTFAAGVTGWVHPRLALVGRLEFAIPIRRPSFEIRDPGPAVELFRPEPVSGRVWLGIEGKLWARRDGSAR